MSLIDSGCISTVMNSVSLYVMTNVVILSFLVHSCISKTRHVCPFFDWLFGLILAIYDFTSLICRSAVMLLETLMARNTLSTSRLPRAILHLTVCGRRIRSKEILRKNFEMRILYM